MAVCSNRRMVLNMRLNSRIDTLLLSLLALIISAMCHCKMWNTYQTYFSKLVLSWLLLFQRRSRMSSITFCEYTTIIQPIRADPIWFPDNELLMCCLLDKLTRLWQALSVCHGDWNELYKRTWHIHVQSCGRNWPTHIHIQSLTHQSGNGNR